MMFKPLGSEPPFRPVEYESEAAPNVEFEPVKGEDVMWNHESESMKRIFADTNPYYLALTMTVSLLHPVFDFLTFKNDVSFWREKNKRWRCAHAVLWASGWCTTLARSLGRSFGD